MLSRELLRARLQLAIGSKLDCRVALPNNDFLSYTHRAVGRDEGVPPA